jgi:hypothetical protein
MHGLFVRGRVTRPPAACKWWVELAVDRARVWRMHSGNGKWWPTPPLTISDHLACHYERAGMSVGERAGCYEGGCRIVCVCEETPVTVRLCFTAVPLLTRSRLCSCNFHA